MAILGGWVFLMSEVPLYRLRACSRRPPPGFSTAVGPYGGPRGGAFSCERGTPLFYLMRKPNQIYHALTHDPLDPGTTLAWRRGDRDRQLVHQKSEQGGEGLDVRGSGITGVPHS